MHRDRLLQGAGACPADLREGLFSSRKDAEPACRQTGRKEIVPNSLRLLYFAACPAELRVRRGGFFFAQRRRGAKELWSARYDFRRPLCLPYFAACLAELRGAIFFFFAQRPVRRGGRKEIMVCSV